MATLKGMTPTVAIVDEWADALAKLGSDSTDSMTELGTSAELAAAAFQAYTWYLNNIQHPRPRRVMTLQERFNKE